MNSIKINYKYLFITLCILLVFLYISIRRLTLDTDIGRSLPKNDPVIGDALYLIKHHPIQDQIAIDIGLNSENPDMLVEISRDVEKKLFSSGLFKKIGMNDIQTVIPELVFNVVDRFPYLFSQKELTKSVEPLLSAKVINNLIEGNSLKLMNLEGFGQSELISKDPIGLKELVLGRMKALIPSGNSKIYKECLISSDNRHVLLTAVPSEPGTDTRQARALTALMLSIGEDLNNKYSRTGNTITVTPVGAFRAALDNETMVRNDSNRSLPLRS